MNDDLHLKLQAHLDGELPAGERASVEAQLAADSEARSLMQELQMTHAALAAGEMPQPLPESREFYWSKIKREIQRSDASLTQPEKRARIASWKYWLAPVAGMAVVVVALVFAGGRATGDGDRFLMTASMEDADAFTYRNDQEGVTLVWLSYPSDHGNGKSAANERGESK